MANFNFNKVILGGRLTADPELKTTPSGSALLRKLSLTRHILLTQKAKARSLYSRLRLCMHRIRLPRMYLTDTEHIRAARIQASRIRQLRNLKKYQMTKNYRSNVIHSI